MLIGKEITIKEAKNKGLEGKKGLVIDETKNTFTLRIADTNRTGTHKTRTEITIIKDQITTITEEQS